MANKKKNARLLNLHACNPHCHWCNCLTVKTPPGGFVPGTKEPDNLATLDHLYSRMSGLKTDGNYHENKPVTVLACAKCNRTRAEKEIQEMGKEKWEEYANHVRDNKLYCLALGRFLMREHLAYF